jgi:hypothetical protein
MRFTMLFFILFFLVGCSDTLDEKRIGAKPSFVMGDKLMGTIVQSSDKNDIGKKLTFTNLNSLYPEILFENGSGYMFEKRFENERTLSLVLAGESKSGGIDSFVIDKKTGKFSRVSTGLISISGVYAVASLGVCN